MLNRRIRTRAAQIGLLSLIAGLLTAVAVEVPDPAAAGTTTSVGIVPAPKTVTAGAGSTSITTATAVVYDDAALAAIADALAHRLSDVTGFPIASERATASDPGDVVLSFSETGTGGAHKVVVDGKVTVSAHDAQSIAMGASSVLQLVMISSPTAPAIPNMTIDDAPDAAFRSQMIDVARGYWSIDDLKRAVDQLSLYKINHLHLHLADDENFMFDSTAFPLLDSTNDHRRPAYSTADLTALEAYAAARGVSIIPELEVPGHSNRLIQHYSGTFGNLGSFTIDPGLPSAVTGLRTLVNEVMDAFPLSSYIHLGGDETSSGAAGTKFAALMNALDGEIVKRGKRTIIWEHLPSETRTQLNRDIVLTWWGYTGPDTLVSEGFTVLNYSPTPGYTTNPLWTPLTPSQESVYSFDALRFRDASVPVDHRVSATTAGSVLGGGAANWAYNGRNGSGVLRPLLPALGATLWNRSGEADYTGFKTRWAAIDARVSALSPVAAAAAYQVHPYTGGNNPLGAQIGDGAGIEVGVGSDGSPYVLSTIGHLRRWVDGAWATVETPTVGDGKVFDFAIGPDGTIAVIMNRSGGPVYRKTPTGAWTDTRGTGKDIAVGADGDTWAVGTTGVVWKLTAGTWARKGDGVTQIAASPVTGGPEVAARSVDGTIYAYNGTSWSDTGGDSESGQMAYTNSDVLHVLSAGRMWVYDGTTWSRKNKTGWTFVVADATGVGGYSDVAIGGPSNSVYVLAY